MSLRAFGPRRLARRDRVGEDLLGRGSARRLDVRDDQLRVVRGGDGRGHDAGGAALVAEPSVPSTIRLYAMSASSVNAGDDTIGACRATGW